MLFFTGHPLIDIGAATLTAMAGRAAPEQLTEADLDAQATWLATHYARNPLKAFLTVAFTSNAWFAQTSYDDASRADAGRRHLFSWKQPGDPTQRCVFTGQPALPNALSKSLAPGRAARAQIPLAPGDQDFNFIALGGAGLPISGLALLCLQAFPLGCAKLAGRLLGIHASDAALTLAFAERFWRANFVAIQAAQAAGDSKLAGAPFGLGTHLVGTLTDILREAEARPDDGPDLPPTSITAYYLTNGQSPELAMYPLPLGVSVFLRRALSLKHRDAWQGMVNAGWPPPPAPKPSQKQPAEPRLRKNALYEDMLGLPGNAPAFLRRHFLRGIKRKNPAATWALAALFLNEVMDMEPFRIENIRAVADRIAAHVAAENDRKLFEAVYGEMRYGALRSRLIKADLDAVRSGQPPLITFDQWLAIFEDGAESARADWKLARDVMVIRVIEQLAAAGWLGAHASEVADRADDADNETPDH